MLQPAHGLHQQREPGLAGRRDRTLEAAGGIPQSALQPVALAQAEHALRADDILEPCGIEIDAGAQRPDLPDRIVIRRGHGIGFDGVEHLQLLRDAIGVLGDEAFVVAVQEAGREPLRLEEALREHGNVHAEPHALIGDVLDPRGMIEPAKAECADHDHAGRAEGCDLSGKAWTQPPRKQGAEGGHGRKHRLLRSCQVGRGERGHRTQGCVHGRLSTSVTT